ncbi:hypothetical protein OJ997_31655 [Solirubrobacter phytolaccae]|uniref:Uncharacterized protein n=1 Tax=Solirubrobacter phytolaccae TaxID=1404360 RepID=A0A9X3NNW4_9ACTN|nr:hypothetical protein [Solirubrobacter phytolaccae]MDA0184902.1 hypothetical protein [Solirubrobacter phytolaccae]
MLRLTLAVLAVGFAFVAYALLARFVLHGPVDQRSLEVSVHRVAAFGMLPEAAACERAEGVWHCMAYDDSGGGASYEVKLRPGSSCWDGRRLQNASYEVDPPRELSGCVRRWQWSIL